ncbi:aldehyde reductase [Mycena sanguinolenta]|nr:aldehyde reductase [Mycena sanguinolenta]
MTTHAVKIVFGGAAIGPGMAMSFPDEESIEKVYQLLERSGCSAIDTARAYLGSEEWMGKTGAGKRFTIDSKTPGGFAPGICTGETIPQHAKETVERLRVESVDIYYIHAPDPVDQLKGINAAYTMGHFKRFGLSNFTAEGVQRVYGICKAKGYPLPTVDQGNYSAIARRVYTEVVPTLRKLGIAFYVYSPVAGGLLTKTCSSCVREQQMAAFRKPTPCASCTKCSTTNPRITWLRKGPLGAVAKAKIDEIWKVVEHEAPLDNYNR